MLYVFISQRFTLSPTYIYHKDVRELPKNLQSMEILCSLLKMKRPSVSSSSFSSIRNVDMTVTSRRCTVSSVLCCWFRHCSEKRLLLLINQAVCEGRQFQITDKCGAE
jgi:hypothetical protein